MIHLVTAGMPKRFIFIWFRTKKDLYLSFCDVGFFTSKKISEEQKKSFLFQICMTLLYLRLQITSGDQKIKAISCYYVAANYGRKRKFFVALLHLLCSGCQLSPFYNF